MFLFFTVGPYLSFVYFKAKEKVQEVFSSLSEHRELRQNGKNSENKNFKLEKGSIVYQEDLKNYLLFSQEFNLLKVDENSVIEQNGSRKEYFLKDDFVLKYPLSNDCLDVYCFQHRLDFAEMPPAIWKGLIGIEDYRYLEHVGIDPLSIARAIAVDIKNWGPVQGGSTLTQQLVKNLFFSNEKSFFRKFHELIYSIYLEKLMTKEEILMTYLNEVYWGSLQGVKLKGIFAASLFYFQKRPKDLSVFESSILISLLRGPSFYSPIKGLDRLKTRSKAVLEKLVQLKLISERSVSEVWKDGDFSHWQKKIMVLNELKPFLEIWRMSNRNQDSSYLNPFERFVFGQVVQRVKRTIEQKNKDLKDLNFSVKFIIGNISDKSQFYYYSKAERDLVKSIEQEKHQIGSIIKPVLYHIYQNLGIDLQGEVSTEKYSKKLKSGKWEPKESHQMANKTIKIIDALKHSLNWPTLRIAEEIGFHRVEKELKYYLKDLQTPLGEYPSQLLGSSELSLASLYQVYQTLFYDQCQNLKEDDEKQNLFVLLSDPTTSNIKNYLQKGMEDFRFFGKTGTTNLGIDNWYVAYNGRELFIIWFGVEEKERVTKDLKLYGAMTSFGIYQDFVYHRGKRFPDFEEFFIKKGCEGLQKKISNSIFPAN